MKGSKSYSVRNLHFYPRRPCDDVRGKRVVIVVQSHQLCARAFDAFPRPKTSGSHPGPFPLHNADWRRNGMVGK